MIVVSDTSPLNYLILIGEADLLAALFDEVVIPPAVEEELSQPETPAEVSRWMANPPPWLRCVRPTSMDASLSLDRGEMEAIALALETSADFLLVDERAATNVARSLGLTCTGTAGVLVEAQRRGLIRLQDALDKLLRTNFRASAALLAELRRFSGQA